MPQVTVSKTTFNAVQRRALVGFTNGQQQPDGSWLVDVTDDQFNSVMARGRPGETFSQVLEYIHWGPPA